MSVQQVVFVPAAPLLVPAVAAGSAVLDDEMHAACAAALSSAVDVGCDEVAVVAPTTGAGSWGPDTTWDFAGFGVPRTDGDMRARLPWQLGIGASLLDDCGWTGPRRYVGVTGADMAVADAERDGRSAELILAIGDGSGCRTERAPGHLDPRAESFDASIAAALGTGDASALADLDRQLADELLCRSLPVWRWVMAAIGETAVTAAELDLHVAPYGVAYFVARWSLR